MGMDPARVESIIRLGGWQAVTGSMTVFRIYARKVIDRYVDNHCLFLGRVHSQEHWKAKLHSYLDVRRPPVLAFKDARSMHVQQLHMAVVRCAAWREELGRLNGLAAKVLQLGISMMPVARYCEYAGAFQMALVKCGDGAIQDFKNAEQIARVSLAKLYRGMLMECQKAYIFEGTCCRDGIQAPPFLESSRVSEGSVAHQHMARFWSDWG